MSFVSVMLIEDTSKTTAIAAMRAAIIPFGSLSAAMSALAVEIADARPVNSPDVSKLLALVFGYPGEIYQEMKHWDIRNKEGRALTLKDGAWQ